MKNHLRNNKIQSKYKARMSQQKNWEVLSFTENFARGTQKAKANLPPLTTNRVGDLLERIRNPKNGLYKNTYSLNRKMITLNLND